VVTVPEGGDGVQVMKAGLNEIADLFVVNKADRDGADRVKAELELSVHLRPAGGWHPPVLMTQAAAVLGIDALIAAIDRHRQYLNEHREPSQESERRSREFMEVLSAEIEERTTRALHNGQGSTLAVINQVRGGKLNPYSAARHVVENQAMMAELMSAGGPHRKRE
jgi:LAO/AO transport system kinase